MDALKASASDGVTDAVGFSVLGVGAGTAKLSLAEHRAIGPAPARGLQLQRDEGADFPGGLTGELGA